MGELVAHVDMAVEYNRDRISRLQKEPRHKRGGIAAARERLKEAIIVKQYLAKGWVK